VLRIASRPPSIGSLRLGRGPESRAVVMGVLGLSLIPLLVGYARVYPMDIAPRRS
jgi:hypothetical protein